MFLAPIVAVRDQLIAAYGDPPFTLEQITLIVCRMTAIDRIFFVQFASPRSNPLWGTAVRWSERPSVYSPAESIVEIRYADHLSEAERRYVICKELCHALERDNGSHVATASAISAIVSSVALRSVGKVGSWNEAAVQAENLAELIAFELLCPIATRKHLVESGEFQQRGIGPIAEKYGFPADFEAVFDLRLIQMAELVMGLVEH